MAKLKERVDRVLEVALVVIMAVSVVNVLWQVFTRFILNNPSSFTEELARYLLIWVGVLGAAYAVGKRVHLALELLPEKLTGRNRRWLELFIEGSVLLFAVTVLVIGGARLVYVQFTLGQTSAAMELPLAYVYAVLPISGVLMVYYTVVHMKHQIRRLSEPVRDEAEQGEVGPLDEDLHVG